MAKKYRVDKSTSLQETSNASTDIIYLPTGPIDEAAERARETMRRLAASLGRAAALSIYQARVRGDRRYR
jgi:hypothetical protein